MPASSIYPPITLPLNTWLGALTCLINFTQTANTNSGAFDIDLLNETQDINLPTGNGKLILSANIPVVNNYAQVSSLLSVTQPVVAEQYIKVTNFRKVPLSFADVFFDQSFTNTTDSSNFVGYVKSLMDASKNIQLYEDMVATMQGWVPTPYTATNPISGGKRGQQISEITIYIKDTAGITDIGQLNSIQTYNSNVIEKTILDTIANLNSPTTLYNEQGMKEFVMKSEIKLFANSSIQNFITINTLATLLNSEKITNNANQVSKVIQIPSGMLTVENQKNLVGWLGHGKKFQWGYFYNLSTAFFDASNLTTNYFAHFSNYMTTIDNFPMVKLVLSTATPPTLPALSTVITNTDLGAITMAGDVPTFAELEPAIIAKNPSYQAGDGTENTFDQTFAIVDGTATKYTGSVTVTYTKA